MSRLHDDELDTSPTLVRALVDSQLPEYAGLALRRWQASGSSNALYRLGEHLLIRLPRQPGGGRTIVKEARWSSYLAAAVTAPVPEVVALGEPGEGYGEQWSVVRFAPGQVPAVPVARSAALGSDLARFVRELRDLAVPASARADPTLQWYRAQPLAVMDEQTRGDLERCRDLPGLDLDLVACEAVWQEAMSLAPATPSTSGVHWLHADLLAENLLVADGRLAAVLDLGGLAVGDPTVDLVVAWEVLDPHGREAFRAELGVADDTWARGRAWALALALLTFPYYWHTMPARCADRLVMARAVLVEAGR